jgi:hypothetical protein
MKHIRVITALSLFLGALLAATPAAAGVRYAIGVRGGVNESRMHGRNAEPHLDFIQGYERRPGRSVGFFATAQVLDFVGLQAEVSAVQRGRKLTFEVPAELGGGLVEFLEQELTLTYLEFPLLGVLSYPVMSGRLVPSVYFGPMVAVAISREAAIRGEGPVYVVSEADDDITGHDYGVVWGASLEFGGGPSTFLLEVRETNGMKTIDAHDIGDVRNRTTSFLAGFRFWLD